MSADLIKIVPVAAGHESVDNDTTRLRLRSPIPYNYLVSPPCTRLVIPVRESYLRHIVGGCSNSECEEKMQE
ncbi:hypothetical protein N7463_004628 [Penicillium fimorum]|uniref:Uncharacterized protein n=1 Tax=Penicillium fimorum TaxID=1882269 RepID=A0A9X0CAK6_9EURO|nr:hypothetical protein N7463_004628 [Penicillium fimorum]